MVWYDELHWTHAFFDIDRTFLNTHRTFLDINRIFLNINRTSRIPYCTCRTKKARSFLPGMSQPPRLPFSLSYLLIAPSSLMSHRSFLTMNWSCLTGHRTFLYLHRTFPHCKLHLPRCGFGSFHAPYRTFLNKHCIFRGLPRTFQFHACTSPAVSCCCRLRHLPILRSNQSHRHNQRSISL